MFRESQKIGSYTLVKKLGRGGFGEVWLVSDEDEYFAVKLPHKDQVDWKQITQEIGLWTLCGKHPNLMPLVGARNFDGQIAIISEYAPDGSLEDLLKEKGKLSEIEAVKMIIGILEGLQHLHESGIIHRDLKPANILLDGKTPRLTDFGISRIITADSLSETISGTWAYMAPECFDGKRNVQTDIWAVGVIFYRMLTGNLPFPQKEQTALVGSIIMREPEKLSDKICREWQEIVINSLCKNSFERYKTVKEMLFEMKDALLYVKLKPAFFTGVRHFENLGNDVKTSMNLFLKALAENYDFSPDYITQIKPHSLRFASELESGVIVIEFDETEDAVQLELSNLVELVPHYKADKWGFTDKTGKIVIPLVYNDAEEFSEGLARVRVDGEKGLDDSKYGFINGLGKLVIPIKYDYAESFSEGLACVNLKGKYGFIDKAGNEFTQIKYDDASSFEGEGYGCITLNGKRGFINRDGTEEFEGPPKREYLKGYYRPRD